MAHLTSRGDPCCYKDEHKGQHRTERRAEDIRRWNNSQGARDAASRYRNRHPAERALAVARFNAKNRVSARRLSAHPSSSRSGRW